MISPSPAPAFDKLPLKQTVLSWKDFPSELLIDVGELHHQI